MRTDGFYSSIQFVLFRRLVRNFIQLEKDIRCTIIIYKNRNRNKGVLVGPEFKSKFKFFKIDLNRPLETGLMTLFRLDEVSVSVRHILFCQPSTV